MKRQTMFRQLLSLVLVGCGSGWALATPAAGADPLGAYQWSVQYLIDHSQTVASEPQNIWPRRNRGLAMSPDGRYVYAGYHHTADGLGQVRRIDLQGADYVIATKSVLRGYMGKGLGVDPDGRVYIAAGNAIAVTDAALSQPHFMIDTDCCEGVAAVKERGDLVVYGAERETGELKRWELEVADGRVVGARLAGLDGDGVIVLPGAASPRQVAVDHKGRVLVTDPKASRVFRVHANGKEIDTGVVDEPMGVGCDGKYYFVTKWRPREIAILDEALQVAGTLAVPWEELQLAPQGNNHQGTLSGIVVVPGKGFYVANEGGQTTNQKSTYGRADYCAGPVGGRQYTDMRHDDNEPILWAQPVGITETAPAGGR